MFKYGEETDAYDKYQDLLEELMKKAEQYEEIENDGNKKLFYEHPKLFHYIVERDFIHGNKVDRFFPCPVTQVPWLLTKNEVIEAGWQTRLERLYKFIEENTSIFSRNYKRIIPRELWETRKKIHKDYNMNKGERKEVSTFNTYHRLNSLVIPLVHSWVKDREKNKQRAFIKNYFLTMNPTLSFVLFDDPVHIVKRPLSESSYTVDALLTFDISSLIKYYKNMPMKTWRTNESISYTNFKGVHKETTPAAIITQLLVFWKFFATPRPESIKSKLKKYYEIL